MKLPFATFLKGRHFSRAALSLGVLTAAVVFFVAGVLLRLLMGPVSLGPLRGPIAEAIRQALPGIVLQYDQAAVQWSRDENRINLVVLGARMLDSKGRVVAQAPRADIDLAARPLVSGRFAVQRITLVGVQLALVRMADGGLRLGGEADKGGEDIIQKLSDVINKSGGTSSLQSFAVRDARLSIFDEPTGLSLVAPHAALNMRARGQAIDAVFDADAVISGRKAHVAADLLLPPKDGPLSGTLAVTGLDLRALAANAPKFAVLKDFPVTASLKARFAFARGGKLVMADFDASASGQAPFDLLKGKTLHMRQLTLSGHFDGMSHRLAIANGELDARELKAQFRSESSLTYDADGALAWVSGDLDMARLVFDAPGIFAGPVRFSSLKLSGAYQLAAHRLDVAKASIAAPGLQLDAAGAVTFDEQKSPGLALSGTIAPLPVRTLLTYWPVFASPGARDWIEANVLAGTLGPAQFQTNFPPGGADQPVLPSEALKISFAISGVEANYVTGLTHLTGVDGTAVLSGDDFTADFTAGHVGNLVVRSGHAVIPALHQHGTIGTFTVHADGAMPDILTLIDMKPLGYPTRFGIDPKSTLGTAGLDLNFRIPMLSDLLVDDVNIGVKAQVAGFAVTLDKLRLSDGAVSFDIDNNHLHQSGSAMLADQRFNFDWTEDFKATGNVTSRINAKGLLTPAVRSLLGIDIGKLVTGSWPVSAVLTGHRGQLLQADATVDLSPAVVTVPFVNMGKPAGEAASARVLVNFGPNDRLTDQSFRITGSGLSATGTASFDKAGVLARLDFSNVRRGPLNDLGFSLIKGADGDIYDLHGRVLDGSSIGRNASCNAPPAPGKAAPERPDEKPDGNWRIIAHLDRLVLCDNVAIAPLSLDMSGSGERLSALTMTAKIGNAPLTAGLENTAQGRRITINAGDAGLMGRALFSFPGLSGGAMTVAATLPGRATDASAATGPDFSGTLTITNFKMVNQSFLARLFAAGSLTGIGDLLQNEGISMEKLTMPFSSKDNVVSIKDAVFTGRAVGGTADGYIDRPKSYLEVKGSLIPAYGLNSFISNVPLLGDILASKKGEGIIGVTYTMKGPIDQPDFVPNPLSVLTPGIFRRIWEGAMPNAAKAPSNQAAAGAPTTPAAPPANATASTPAQGKSQ